MPPIPDTMRAAVYRSRRVLDVTEISTPVPADDEVLVAIDFCGVCGSDLHFVIEGWSRPDTVHGHEWAGRVAALGNAVTGWSLGDRVVGGPTPCGSCRWCEAGRSSLCRDNGMNVEGGANVGAYAEFHTAKATAVHRIPEGLDARTAALTEPLAVALHGITRSGAAPGSRVLVTGAGPIGLLTVAALRAQGVDDVTVSEPVAARREQALRVGAKAAVEPGELPEVPMLPMALVPEPYDVAIECSGNAAAMESALGQLGPAGTLVFSGTGLQRPAFDTNRILLLELVLTGAYEYDDDGFDDALALLASGRLPVDELAEPDDTPLDQLLDAMQALAAGEITRKVMVTPT